jgi:predicted metal-dependent hydrolase
VQFEFSLKSVHRSFVGELPVLGNGQIPVALIHNKRARRYVLRLRPDGSARVTIPRGGSITEARKFAERNAAWLERAQQRLSTRSARPKEWLIGTAIHFAGELVAIKPGENGRILFGTETIKVKESDSDLRRAIERYLWKMAANEFPPRVIEQAAVHQLNVRRVTVRNQKSRWGSCSPRGTISLNWRLIQTPQFVRDYVILHELMHLREMNHSVRFWREVESVCPDYKAAESWLKQNSALLG